MIKNLTKVENEASLFYSLYHLNRLLNRYESDLRTSNLNFEKEKAEIKDLINFLLSQLPSFGVSIMIDSKTGKISLTDQYDSWYSWWEDYYKSLNDLEKEKFISLYNNKQDLSSFIPFGTWKRKSI